MVIRILDTVANTALGFGVLLILVFVLRLSGVPASNEVLIGAAAVAIALGAALGALADQLRHRREGRS